MPLKKLINQILLFYCQFVADRDFHWIQKQCHFFFNGLIAKSINTTFWPSPFFFWIWLYFSFTSFIFKFSFYFTEGITLKYWCWFLPHQHEPGIGICLPSFLSLPSTFQTFPPSRLSQSNLALLFLTSVALTIDFTLVKNLESGFHYTASSSPTGPLTIQWQSWGTLYSRSSSIPPPPPRLPPEIWPIHMTVQFCEFQTKGNTK